MQKSIVVLRTCLTLTVLLLFPASGIAQITVWQQTNGPYGGSVRSIAVNTSGNVLAGTLNGGVSLSTDNGGNWTQTGLTNTSVQALVIGIPVSNSINFEGIIFAGTGDGVFRSTDGGNNWTPINSGLSNTDVQALLATSDGFESFQLVANAAGAINPPLSAAFAFQGFPTLGNADPSSTGQASGQRWAFHTGDNGGSSGGGTRGSYSAFISRSLRGTNFSRVVPFDWEMRFTGESWAVLAFTTGAIQKVPFELWNIGVNTPNDTSDDYRIIPWYLEQSGVGGLEPDTTYGLTPNDHSASGGDDDPFTQWIYWRIPDEHLNNSPGTAGYDAYIAAIDTSNVTGYGTYAFDGDEAMARSVLVCWNCDDVSGGILDPSVERVPEQGTILRLISTKPDIFLFAGTSTGGVFRSTDDGDNWAQINTGLTNTDVRALAMNTTGDVFSGTFDGMFRTTDNGDNWAQINTGLTTTDIQAVTINDSDDVFVGTIGGGVFRSTDNGDNWTQINTGLSTTDVLALTVDTAGNIFAGTLFGGVFLSIDNGDNWTQINTGLTNTVIQALTAPGALYAGSDGSGVFRSDDSGTNWTQIDSGLTNTVIQSLAINSNEDIFAGNHGVSSTLGALFRSTDNGDNWTLTALPNRAEALVINSQDDIFAGGGTSNTLFRSIDNGQTWTAINNGLNLNGVQALAINASDFLFAGTQGSGVFRSNSNGNLWVESGLNNTDVKALAINSSGHIFAGNQFNNDGVFRSTDNGSNWTQINTGLTNTNVQALAIKPNDDIFAGTLSGGVFRSTDNGDNWTKINTGLTDTTVFALAINSNSHIFAGTLNNGVFFSNDNGDSWTQINAGLTNTTVFALAINSSDSLFAGTFGAGVFARGEFITITSPNGGENWQIGSNQNITWSSSGTSGLVDIDLSTNGGTNFSPVFSNITDDGLESWSVSNTPCDSCLIRITDSDSSASDVSDSFFTISDEQIITVLAEKINLISFNVLPPDLAVDILLDDLDSLLVAQDDEGQFYIPPFSVNTIGNVDITNGYQVFITGAADDNVMNDGLTLVPEDYSQSFGNTRLYTIGYPYQNLNPVEDVFASIADSVEVVADDLGQFWIPAFAVNTIGNMQPGKGYQIFVNQPVNYTYPAISTLSASLAKAIRTAPQSTPKHFEYQRTGLPYGVLVTGSEQELESRDEIAVFDGDLCVGAAVFTGEYPLVIAAWEEHEEYGLTGFKTGNKIVLRVWKSFEQLEMDGVASFANSNESTFHGGPISVLSITSLAGPESIPLTFALDQNYPNPFNPETTIRYHLPQKSKVTLVIYNLQGQLIRKLESDDRNAGSYQVVWDSRNDKGRQVASGVYFYRFQAGDFTDVKKLILMK